MFPVPKPRKPSTSLRMASPHPRAGRSPARFRGEGFRSLWISPSNSVEILNVFLAQACVPDAPKERQPSHDPPKLSGDLGKEDREWMSRAGHSVL